jgi:hypothetical protein
LLSLSIADGCFLDIRYVGGDRFWNFLCRMVLVRG